MNARDVQRRLVADRFRESFVLHNYTPKRWWECDVFEVTKARMFYEHEIKLTMKDFRADREKERTKFVPVDKAVGGRHWDEVRDAGKHELLANEPRVAALRGWNVPCRFQYVVAESIAAQVRLELPEWAGLTVAVSEPSRQDPHGVRLHQLVAAPRLHEHKLDVEVLEHAKSVVYYRMHSLFTKGRFLGEKDVA